MSTAKQWAAFAEKIERDRAFGRAIDREFFQLLGDRTVGQGEPGSGNCWKLFDPRHRRWCALPRVTGDLTDALRQWPDKWALSLHGETRLAHFYAEASCAWSIPHDDGSRRTLNQQRVHCANVAPARAILGCIARIHHFRLQHPRAVIL